MRLINHSFILYLFLQCLLQLADAVHKLNTKNTSYTKSKHTCASPHISRFSTSFISPNTSGNAPRNKVIGVVIGALFDVLCVVRTCAIKCAMEISFCLPAICAKFAPNHSL
eukprot:109193_1